jgi:hypothetical protein
LEAEEGFLLIWLVAHNGGDAVHDHID